MIRWSADVPRGWRHGRPRAVRRQDRRCSGDPGCSHPGRRPLLRRLNRDPFQALSPRTPRGHLMFGGLELAAGVQAGSLSKTDRYVTAFTAGTALWNMGAAYVGGLALWYGFQRRWLRL